ncbi:MAG: cupin domain-containing protein [Gammaproteobacteria bacterium]
MPFIAQEQAPSFELHGASFTGLASPSRGSSENAVWIVSLPPGQQGVTHRLTREEIFVALEGRARAQVGPDSLDVTEGSCLVVPAGLDFSLTNDGVEAFRAVAVLPVGGQASVGGGPAFTPPWAA